MYNTYIRIHIYIYIYICTLLLGHPWHLRKRPACPEPVWRPAKLDRDAGAKL